MTPRPISVDTLQDEEQRPAQPIADEATQNDSLERCLMHIAAELNRPITTAAFQSHQTLKETGFSVPDAIAIGERAGLQIGFGKQSLDAIDKMPLPAILLLEDNKAIVVHSRERDDVLVVFDPEATGQLVESRVSDIAKVFAGYALIFRPTAQSVGEGRNRDRKGHWFWSTMIQNKWMYVQVILAAALTNILGLVTSLFTMVVYDRILPNNAIESLVALTIGVGIALVFDFVVKSLRSSFIDRAGERADKAMGRKIFDQLLDMQMQAKKGSTGAMASTLREFETLREFFTSATLVAVVDLPFIFLFLWVISMIGGPLVLVPAIAVPVVLILGIGVQPLLARLADQNFSDGQNKQSVLVETVTGLETIKAIGAGRIMRARWEEAISKQSEHGMKTRAISQFAMNATASTQQAAQILIVFYGVFLIAEGTISMGALIAASLLTGRALGPLAQLAQTLVRLNSARTSFRSLDQLMEADNEHPADRKWLSRPKLDGQIRFENVAFAYPDQQVDALKDVSFTIEPGEKVAILGRIGSGKSTVARLILGLYTPKSGVVLVDGTDIRQIDPGDLRRNIGSVLQDIWLFSGTVRDNIAVGAMRPRDEDILEVARTAGVDEFVRKHPQGYDMMLAERGDGLSGGQKQAITLARALLGAPPILLMDEPTSSMDVQSEQAVIAKLKTDLADRTVIIVTHRTSLLELVDRVIVIDDGRVVADGPKSILSRPSPVAARRGGDVVQS